MNSMSISSGIRTGLNRRNISFAALAMVALVGVLLPDLAFAQGLEKVNDGVEKILDTLRMVSVGVVTIAVIWSGYKLAFAHARLADIIPILGGGIMIGAAAEIARYLVQ